MTGMKHRPATADFRAPRLLEAAQLERAYLTFGPECFNQRSEQNSGHPRLSVH